MNSQKLPIKPKKRNKFIDEKDKEKIAKYYKEIEESNETNRKIILEKKNKCKYTLQFDSESKLYFLDEYDYNQFDSFGFIKDKKIYFNQIESIYLYQIGYVLIETELLPEDPSMFNLYSYLRRNGKIVSCCDYLDESFNNYVIIYDDNEQFKSKKISEIIFMHTEKSINFDTMQTVIQTSEKIMKKVNQNVKNVDVIVAFTEGINITFIKLSNNNMI